MKGGLLPTQCVFFTFFLFPSVLLVTSLEKGETYKLFCMILNLTLDTKLPILCDIFNMDHVDLNLLFTSLIACQNLNPISRSQISNEPIPAVLLKLLTAYHIIIQDEVVNIFTLGEIKQG